MVTNEQIKKLIKIECMNESFSISEDCLTGLRSIIDIEDTSSFLFEQGKLHPDVFENIRNIDIKKLSVGEKNSYSMSRCWITTTCNIVYMDGTTQQLEFGTSAYMFDQYSDFLNNNPDLIKVFSLRKIVIDKLSPEDSKLRDILRNNILNKTPAILFPCYGTQFEKYKNEKISDVEIIGIPELKISKTIQITTSEVCYNIYGGIKFKWVYGGDIDDFSGQQEEEWVDECFADKGIEIYQLAKEIYTEGYGTIFLYQVGVFLGEFFSNLTQFSNKEQNAIIDKQIMSNKMEGSFHRGTKNKTKRDTKKADNRINITKLIIWAVIIAGVMLSIVLFLEK